MYGTYLDSWKTMESANLRATSHTFSNLESMARRKADFDWSVSVVENVMFIHRYP